MFDPERMLGQMLGGALGGAFGGSKKRRRGMLGGNSAMKAQVGIGLLGVAIAAYEHFQQQRGGFAGGASAPAPAGGNTTPPPPPGARASPPPPPGASAVPPPPPGASTATHSSPGAPDAAGDAIVIMQAMIAAATADGRIDDEERARILERAAAGGVDDDGRRFLEVELATPKSLEVIAGLAHRGIAADVYAASLLAISLDTPQERDYLERLAHALSLDRAQRDEIHTRLAV